MNIVSSEKEYPGDKRGRIYWLALMAIILGVTLLQRDILEAMGKQPYPAPGLNFILGGLFALQLFYFIESLFRPKRRICDHFYMDNYDRHIMSWNQVKSVTVKGNRITLYLSEAGLQKTHNISISSVPDRAEFINEIKRICEVRGISFKEQQ